MSTTLAERLRIALDARKMKQSHLEDRIGVSKGYVTRILKGERTNVSFERVWAMADALNVRGEWLAEGKEPMDLPSRAPLPPSMQAVADAFRPVLGRDAESFAAKVLANIDETLAKNPPISAEARQKIIDDVAESLLEGIAATRHTWPAMLAQLEPTKPPPRRRKATRRSKK